MLNDGDKVCVGVSGGADSMCLLHLLNVYKTELNITVSAAHINHCIRGAESDADEKFVRDFCAQNNIPLFVHRVDIPSLCRKRNESTELCARNERYSFFDSLSVDKIATAHTGSDCIETALMNLSRGSALHGLASIPPVRGNIIRPLIEFTREETENYCTENGINFVTDSSNLSNDYTRNKFRNLVISQLKTISPSFEGNALRCISMLREDDYFLNDLTDKEFECCYSQQNESLDCEKLRKLPNALKSRIVAKYFSIHTDSDFEMRHIKLICQHLDCDFSVTLPDGVIVCSDGKEIFIKKEKKVFAPLCIEINKNENRQIQFFDTVIHICTSNEYPEYENSSAVIDFYKIDDIIKIRSRIQGDEILLAKRRCTKSLKKLFSEMKIPVEKRNCIPVIADKNGVIWTNVTGIDASRACNSKTKKYMIIKTESANND